MTPDGASQRRRRRSKAALGVGVSLLLAGHVAYWYLPRGRAAALDPATLAGGLVVAGGGDRLWLPFPHQSAVASRLLDLAELEGGGQSLPRFGPLRLPPAHEIAVARSHGATTVVARLYPSLAAIGRLAGLLTGNPWLRAGRFEHRGEPVEVEWRGTTWMVVVGAPVAARDVTERLELRHRDLPVLAAVAFDAERWPAAAKSVPVDPSALWGLLALGPGEAELMVVAASARRPVPSGLPAPEVSVAPPALSASRLERCAAGDAEVAACVWATAPAGGETALLWLAPTTPAEPSVLRLPSAAVLVRGAAGERLPRPDLPAERLARRLDATLSVGERGGWAITALDGRSLESARALAEAWSAPAGGADGSGELAAWLAPRPLQLIASELASASANLPLLDPEDARGWQLLASTLARLESVAAVWLFAGRDRVLVRWVGDASALAEAAAAESP